MMQRVTMSTPPLLILTTTLLLLIVTLTYGEFVALTNVPQEFGSIALGLPECPPDVNGEGLQNLTNLIAWNVHPTNSTTGYEVVISMQPAGLVDVLVDETGTLNFAYNNLSSSLQSEATGVRIEIPASRRIESIVTNSNGVHAKIHAGFTSDSIQAVDIRHADCTFVMDSTMNRTDDAGLSIVWALNVETDHTIIHIGGNVGSLNLTGLNNTVSVQGGISRMMLNGVHDSEVVVTGNLTFPGGSSLTGSENSITFGGDVTSLVVAGSDNGLTINTITSLSFAQGFENMLITTNCSDDGIVIRSDGGPGGNVMTCTEYPNLFNVTLDDIPIVPETHDQRLPLSSMMCEFGDNNQTDTPESEDDGSAGGSNSGSSSSGRLWHVAAWKTCRLLLLVASALFPFVII
jgi:hypothetical protein